MPQSGRQGWRGVAIGTIAGAACVFALVGWKSTSKLNTLWDERVDLDIATALARAPIRGEAKPLDPTQFRLPMYVTAAAFAASGRDDLATARGVSIAVGALGIVLAGGMAWRLFGAATGAWTAVLLALSPYYLAYGRIAMTEGDIFLATTVTGACWAFAAFVERPTSWRWLLTGIALGLAIGAKAYAIVLVAMFATCMPYLPRRAGGGGLWFAILAAAGFAVATLIATAAWRADTIFAWIVFACGFFAVCAATWRTDAADLGRWRAWFGFVIVAGVTWGALMPEHVTRSGILRGLAARTAHWDHRAPFGLLADQLRLYFGVVLLKGTMLIGVLSVGAMAYGLNRARGDWRWRLSAGSVAVWIVAMCALPLRQTFYLMGVYPLLMAVTAAGGVTLIRWMGRRRAVLGVLGLVTIAIAPTARMALRAAEAYPDFQLFPDDVIGTRWMGAEARGYRNLIQTNSDGVEDVVRWCLENVPAGSRVVSYLWEDSIIDRLLTEKPRFELVRRGISQASEVVPPPPPTAGADYILMHINNILGYGDRPADAPPPVELERDFRPVYIVRRGRSQMPVAWVYERRGNESRPASRDGKRSSR